MANTTHLVSDNQYRSEAERLRIEVRDWQDSSEAFRADAIRLHAALSQAVAYADVAAQMEGMPAGKQCKRLTATAVGENPAATAIFDVAAARTLLSEISPGAHPEAAPQQTSGCAECDCQNPPQGCNWIHSR